MTKIFVIDNGGQWTHREWRTLRYLDIETKIIQNTTSINDIISEKVNGLVLSGGSPRIGLEGDLGNCSEILDNIEIHEKTDCLAVRSALHAASIDNLSGHCIY